MPATAPLTRCPFRVHRAALVLCLGACAHTTPDGKLELSRARVAVARGKTSEAIELYDRVPRFSAAWPRALFEGGRERAKARAHSRALGMFMTLHAPQLADWVFPEAFAIEAQIYLRNCYYEKPLAIAREFRTNVLPLRERVIALVGGAPYANEVRWIATRLADGEQLDQLLVELDLADAALARVEEAVHEQRARLVDNGTRKLEAIMIVDEEHHNWKFDGTYWPDELGNYRVPIVSRCEPRR